MSKCLICGKELGTGDSSMHYLCSKCLEKNNPIKVFMPQDLNSIQVVECQQCKEKEQRILELESEKQTAVKEFAEKIKDKLFECGDFRNNAWEIINNLLKEKGIESGKINK